MKVVRSGLVVGVLCGLAASLALVAACGSSNNENVTLGGECFSASDCAPGLVCIPQKNSTTRICSNDLSGVTGTPEDAPDGSQREGGDATLLDSPASDSPVEQDTGAQDTGADTGPKDAGADG